MSDALSFAEIDRQHVELLPARTVLSLFSAGGRGSSHGASTSTSTATPGVTGGTASASASHFYSEGDVLMIVTDGTTGTASGGSGGVVER